MRTTIEGASPKGVESDAQRAKAVVAAARRDKMLPEQLASLIHQQEHDEAARNAGLPDNVRAEIEQRASALGVTVTLSDDGWHLELVAGR